MRKCKFFLTLLILLIFSDFFHSQTPPEERYRKLFLIDDLASRGELKSYTLNTKELYGIDKNIIAYNFFVGEGIVLFSALPNLWEGEDWLKVDYEKIKEKIVPKNDIFYFISNNFNEVKKTNKFGLLKKVGNDYYVPLTCLTEYISIRSYSLPFIVDKNTINLLDRKVSIQEMYDYWKKTNTKHNFPLEVKNGGSFLDTSLERYYMSKEFKIKNEEAYQFWAFNSWNVMDGYNLQRGIDRFVYIPGKGIVGGSYDFYFEFNLAQEGKISRDKLWDNIINEKVMLAEELK